MERIESMRNALLHVEYGRCGLFMQWSARVQSRENHVPCIDKKS